MACLFLPSHSSHVLQPLDLSIFGPLKTYYRQEVAAFGLTADSEPVLKAIFITCYARAYVKGFSSKNIKSGFNAAGIYPFRPSRAYNSRQVVQPPSDVVDAKVSDSPTSVLKTPKSGVDIRQLWTRFRDEITQNSNTRLFGRKVEKALVLSVLYIFHSHLGSGDSLLLYRL